MKERFPDISGFFDELWGAYGALGYEGIDGEKAEKVIECMENVLDEFERGSNLKFKEGR